MLQNIADHHVRTDTSARIRDNADVATSPTVLADVLTLVDTAQLVQTILGEAFPATSFTVKIAMNEHGSQLHVDWTDGPRDLQVARFVMPLQATRLVNGGRVERVEHFTLTSAGRQTVRLAADRIALSRQFSDQAIEQALARLASRYGDYLSPETRTSMTVTAFRDGQLQAVEIPGVHRIGGHRSGSTVQTDIATMLAETTDMHGFPRSATASRLFVRRNVH